MENFIKRVLTEKFSFFCTYKQLKFIMKKMSIAIKNISKEYYEGKKKDK